MNSPFIDSRLELQYIKEIGGWGIFTNENIDEGVVVEIAPVVVFPRRLMEVAIWSCQAEGVPSADLKIDQYTINWGPDGAFPMGWTGLYNHKDDNNCQFIADYTANLVGIKTIKPISAAEQLFVSYGEHWFEQKGYVKKYSF